MHRILIIEDEPDIAELVSFHLTRAGFRTAVLTHGLGALEKVRRDRPALVILDLMLPDTDGIEICKRLKYDDTTRAIPVLILTAKITEMDRILGLELGADDYLAKPFSPRELVLRVQAILRRLHPERDSRSDVVIGPVRIDFDGRRVYYQQRPIELTATEFNLLIYLSQRPGRVVRREDLLQSVWGYNYLGGTRTVDTHVQRLRSKLRDASEWIETVRGVGYRFRDQGSDK